MPILAISGSRSDPGIDYRQLNTPKIGYKLVYLALARREC